MDLRREIRTSLQAAAGASLPGAGISRLPFSREHQQALDIIGGWMRAAGMHVRLDNAGTLIGRANSGGGRHAKLLLFGSHQDSVINGGKYDGIMGILLPLLAMRALAERGTRLPYHVECLAFADEEGVRFPTALLGPRALAGTFDDGNLAFADNNGITLRQAMRDFGLRPEKIKTLARDPAAIIGYVETHIEQGPVLENAAQALGIVSAICGIERHQINIKGVAAHAGTTPAALRYDALATAAELILGVEQQALADEHVNAIVGFIQARPNAVNVVTGDVCLTVEIRAARDSKRKAFTAALSRLCRDIARRRRLRITRRCTYAQTAVSCSKALAAYLRTAVQSVGQQGVILPSGATHDASAMADLCPTAMLFVRCKGGVSHHPAEHAAIGDMVLATRALERFLVGVGNATAALPGG